MIRCQHHIVVYAQKYQRGILVLVLFSAFVCYTVMDMLRYDEMKSMMLYKDLHEDVGDPRQTCKIPIFHPFEKNVRHHFRTPRSIRCRSRTPLLTFIDEDGFLRYNVTAFREQGYTVNSLKCYYQEISRVKGSDVKVSFGEKKPMNGYDKPEQDFVYVTCKRFLWLPNVYTMFHAHPCKKSSVRPFRDETEVGVAVVGLDSVSRLNFMRQLPKSYSFIENEMSGTVLKGFNKVGENTFPNLMAILTGHPLRNTDKSLFFDDWPLIWRTLREDGVATLYGEDLSSIMTFSWWGSGFDADPTTHYFRPFWLAVDKSLAVVSSSSLCLGPVPKHQIYLRYLKSFLSSYRNSPVFLFSLQNELSHDYLNTVGVIDDDLKEFLAASLTEKLFNRTILFVLSDHGNRFDDFRQTKQGKAEDRMPMVVVVLPKWFARLNPHIVTALELNSQRLTSSFDLYSTFIDIFLQKTANEVSHEGMSSYKFKKPSHGLSLFRPVPLNRTCSDAGIPEMYCICMEAVKQIPVDGNLARASLRILGDYINNEILEGESRTWRESSKVVHHLDLGSLKSCAKLTFESEEAEVTFKPDGRRLVHVTFKASPSGAVFEGRVMWHRGDDVEAGEVYQDIVRVNAYGNQADCLEKTLMIVVPLTRSVCFCNS